MRETAIRGKWLFLILFAGMLLYGAHIREDDRREITAGRYQETSAKANEETPEEIQEEAAAELPPRVALTFDDGPHPVYTETLLEGLRERGVCATFFVVGENVESNAALIKEMAQDGHLIGNHTWDHSDISKMDSEEACAQLLQTDGVVKEITGRGTAYVRPPFGNWDEDLDGLVSMIAVKWTIDPMDWTTSNVSQVVEAVVTKAEDGSIILLHDCYASSVEAALRIADILTERGFVFVTVEELLLE